MSKCVEGDRKTRRALRGEYIRLGLNEQLGSEDGQDAVAG